MDWTELEQALQFLENEDDVIVIQVPYQTDIGVVQDYLMEKHAHDLGIIHRRSDEITTKVGTIKLESVQATTADSPGHDYPTFLVPRADGDIGLNRIDYD